MQFLLGVFRIKLILDTNCLVSSVLSPYGRGASMARTTQFAENKKKIK